MTVAVAESTAVRNRHQGQAALRRTGRLLRVRPLVALAVAVVGVTTTVPGVAAPAERSFGRSIDRLPGYEGQAVCDPVDKPGVVAFREMARATYPSVPATGISRGCDIGGRSEHKEGRAWDWPLRASDPAQAARADEFLSWLLATDEHGNSYARARRFGIMYIIWNWQVWSSYRADQGWQPYTGASPHSDHIHFSFSWDGALGRTSWWHPSGRPLCPPPAASSAPTTSTARTGFVPVAPTRLLDTRDGTGLNGLGCRLGDRGVVDLQVLGRGGVPTSGVTAVALNVTGTSTSTPTWVAAYPTGAAFGGTSSVNLMPGVDRAGSVIVPVGSNGRVRLENHKYSNDLVVDVTGYFTSATSGAGYAPVAPARLLDTREEQAPLVAGSERVLSVTGRGGVPGEGVRAVAVNITVTEATAAGHLTAWAAGTPRPLASVVNVSAGDTVPNRAVLPVSETGQVALQFSSGAAHVLVDVVGWFGAGGTERYGTVSPARILDTRSGLGVSGRVGERQTATLQVAGRGGVPTSGVRAVVMTLTATEPLGPTVVTAWGTGPRPDTSDLNPAPGRDDANLLIVPVGPGGTIQLYNNVGSVHLVGDVLGWYGAS